MEKFPELTVVTAFSDSIEIVGVYLDALKEIEGFRQLKYVFGIDGDKYGRIRILIEKFRNEEAVDVFIFENETPCGFAKTINKLISHVDTKLTLLMDSDVRISSACLAELLREMRSQGNASVQPTLVYPQSNKLQSYGHIFGPLFNKHALNGQQFEKLFPLPDRDAQGISTACQIFKTRLFRIVGGLDDGYYNAYEGLELSLKLRHLGYKTRVLGRAYAYHFQGKSRGKLKLNESIATAKFWSRWHSIIEPDFNQFYNSKKLQETRNKIIVNCSSFENWDDHVPEISRHKDIALNVRNRDQHIELWSTLPSAFLKYPGTIIFLCDHFNQVTNNYYWFSRRRDRKTIGLDLHGNMVCL